MSGGCKGRKRQLSCIEICAGAGGQALGLEQAGFEGVAHVELEPAACATLKLNRPNWNVIEGDVRDFDATPFKGVDLLAGGVPWLKERSRAKELGVLSLQRDECIAFHTRNRTLFDD